MNHTLTVGNGLKGYPVHMKRANSKRIWQWYNQIMDFWTLYSI